jgi:DNA-binding NtrC family response regulator
MKSYHILLIDDDRSLCEVLEFNLKEQGYKVDTVFTGKQGFAQLKKRNYHLVITDMKMPGMDGMQVLKELQKTKPQTMVIIITAFASEEMAAEAIKLGAYEYITKPINLEDFNHMVRNALERFQLVEKNQ